MTNTPNTPTPTHSNAGDSIKRLGSAIDLTALANQSIVAVADGGEAVPKKRKTRRQSLTGVRVDPNDKNESPSQKSKSGTRATRKKRRTSLTNFSEAIKNQITNMFDAEEEAVPIETIPSMADYIKSVSGNVEKVGPNAGNVSPCTHPFFVSSLSIVHPCEKDIDRKRSGLMNEPRRKSATENEIKVFAAGLVAGATPTTVVDPGASEDSLDTGQHTVDYTVSRTPSSPSDKNALVSLYLI